MKNSLKTRDQIINIKADLKRIFENWLEKKSIENRATLIFEVDEDIAINESRKIEGIAIFDYIDCAYPLLEYNADGVAISNRWQSCIDAVIKSSKPKNRASKPQYKTIFAISDAVAALNPAIDMLQKLNKTFQDYTNNNQIPTSDENELLSMLEGTAFVYVKEFYKIINAIEDKDFQEIKNSSDFTKFNIRLNNVNPDNTHEFDSSDDEEDLSVFDGFKYDPSYPAIPAELSNLSPSDFIKSWQELFTILTANWMTNSLSESTASIQEEFTHEQMPLENQDLVLELDNQRPSSKQQIIRYIIPINSVISIAMEYNEETNSYTAYKLNAVEASKTVLSTAELNRLANQFLSKSISSNRGLILDADRNQLKLTTLDLCSIFANFSTPVVVNDSNTLPILTNTIMDLETAEVRSSPVTSNQSFTQEEKEEEEEEEYQQEPSNENTISNKSKNQNLLSYLFNSIIEAIRSIIRTIQALISKLLCINKEKTSNDPITATPETNQHANVKNPISTQEPGCFKAMLSCYKSYRTTTDSDNKNLNRMRCSKASLQQPMV